MRSCCALYVDAGYLLASAATRVTGTSLRGGVHVDHDELVPRLIRQVETDSGLPLLRLNWYDSGGEAGGQPDGVQARLGLMARVKLRLGRLSYAGEQKGVDLRLGLDLATHARNNIVDVAYLLSGDDDLTEAVEEAQGHGVQVILLAVPDEAGEPFGVARHLQRESDGLTLIEEETIRESVRAAGPRPGLVGVPTPAARGEGSASALPPGSLESLQSPESESSRAAGAAASSAARSRPVPADAPAPAARTGAASDGGGSPAPTPALLSGHRARPSAAGAPAAHGGGAPSPAAFAGSRPRPAGEATVIYSTSTGRPSEPPHLPGARVADDAVIEQVCSRVLGTWLASASEADQTRLFANRPAILSDIDRALLQDLSTRLGVYDIREEDRYALRAQFWAEATQRLPREAAQSGGADEGPSSGSEGQDSTPRAASGGGR